MQAPQGHEVSPEFQLAFQGRLFQQVKADNCSVGSRWAGLSLIVLAALQA